MQSTHLYTALLLALLVLANTSCKKEATPAPTPVQHTDVNRSNGGCSQAAQTIFPMLSDPNVTDQEIVQAVIELETSCNSLLKKLIDNPYRTIHPTDLQVALVYHSPLTDPVLKELVRKNNPHLPKTLVEEVLAHNLPLSTHLQNEVQAHRPDITVLPDMSFNDWLAQNNHRLHEVTREEILAFESRDTQREIFRAIPNRTKAEVWQQKFEALINSGKYGGESLEFIKFLRNLITEDLYNGTITQEMRNVLIEAKARALNLFEYYEAKLMASLLDDTFLRAANGDISLVSCDCNSVDDWCDTFQNAGITCSGDCGLDSERGCGWFWLAACNGDCQPQGPR